MSSALTALWSEERARGLARLAGSRARATLPVREALIARLIANATLPSVVRGLNVRLLSDNQILVGADVRVLGLGKRLEARLRVEPAADTGPPRTIRLSFVNRSLLASAASLAGSLLGGLPDGIAMTESVVTVDLDRLASRAGVADLAGHVRGIALATQEGVLWVDVDVEISEAAPARDVAGPEDGRRAIRTHAAAMQPQEIATLLSGLRADVSVRIAESLANSVIEAMVADARSSASPSAREPVSSGDWGPLVEALRPPRVRFEAGAMLVEGSIAL